MRIVLLGDYYEQYLRDFHFANGTRLAGLTYREHSEFLARDYFGSMPSYLNHFRYIGYESELLVANYYPLQQKWLDERGIKLVAGPEQKKRVALLQIEEILPDIFFIGSHFDYYGEFLHAVSKTTPNILAWICCPFPATLEFGPIKCVLTASEKLQALFRSMGLKSERLLASFDPDILKLLQKRPKTVPVSFIGGLTSSHKARVAALEWLVGNKLAIDVWGYLYFGRKDRIRRFFKRRTIEQRHHGPVWGLAMYQALADSKMTLNVCIDFIKELGGGGNMRFFEALGCGALLVTDFAPEMAGAFVPGRDLVASNTREEMLERVNYYLDHETEMAKIAEQGQKTCLRQHSLPVRILEFDAIIRKHIG